MPADDVRAIVNEVLGATPAAEGATPAGDAHEVIYQIQQPGTEGWSPMNEARIPEFLAHGWKVRVARIRYERIDGDKQGAQGGGK